MLLRRKQEGKVAMGIKVRQCRYRIYKLITLPFSLVLQSKK